MIVTPELGLAHVVVVVMGLGVMVVVLVVEDVTVEVEVPEVKKTFVVVEVIVNVFVIVVDVKNLLVEVPVLVVTEVIVFVIGLNSIITGQTHSLLRIQNFGQLPCVRSKQSPSPHAVCPPVPQDIAACVAR